MTHNGFRNTSAVVWMFAGALLFALMAAMTRSLAGVISWSTIALVRSLFAFVFAASATVITRKQFVIWQSQALWIRSVAGAASLLCCFFAMTRLPLADSITLFYMHPLWIVCLSWLVFGYPVRAREMLAVAAGAVGVVLIVQPRFATIGLATTVALAGSVAAAVAMLGLHRIRGVSIWAIVAHFSAVSSIAATCCWLVVPDTGLAWTSHVAPIASLAGIGTCATLAQFCMTRAYATGNPTWVSVAGLSEVVFAAVLDVVIWNRVFSLAALVGMLMVVAPTVFLTTRRIRVPDEEVGAATTVETVPVDAGSG